MKQAATLFLPLLIALPTLSFTSVPAFSANASKTMEVSEFLNAKGAYFASHIPAQSLYQLMAAEMALDREHPEIALANYIAAAQETQDAAIAARATQIALSTSSLEVALIPALIWAKSDPKNLEAQITTAALLIRMDQVDKAVSYLRQSERLNAEESFQYFLLLFRQLQKEEDSKRVIQALQALSKEETKENSAHLALTEIYLHQGKDKKALEMSQAALKLDPQSISAIQLYAESLLRAKSKEAAKAYLDKVNEKNPDHLLLGQHYIQFLLDNGFESTARKEVERWSKQTGLKTEALLHFARISMQSQWFDLAETILNKTRKFTESKDLSHYFLARLAEMQDKEDGAIEWFKQVLTGPFHVLSQLRASLLLADKSRFDDALTVLARTQPEDENDKKQIILTTVEVLNRANRHQEAYKILNANIKIVPNDLEFLYARSVISDHLGHLDIAEKDLKTILSGHPNNVEALNTLGFLLADKTQRFKESEKYLSQALKISPNNASVLDSFGWLYYKMGDKEKSLSYLQKALKLMPDAEIAAHLGEVMWQMQNYDGAKQVWLEALKQNPKQKTILNVMKRLMGNNASLK